MKIDRIDIVKPVIYQRNGSCRARVWVLMVPLTALPRPAESLDCDMRAVVHD